MVTEVANLDVGSYDILRVWDGTQRQVRGSPKGLGEAHNLLLIAK